MNQPDDLPPSLPIAPEIFAWRHQHRPTNHVEGYEHRAHAKGYLRRCAEEAGLHLDHLQRDEPAKRAMQAAGYANWHKFTRHLAAWHDLTKPIPRSYAECIGITPGEFLAAVDEDRLDHGRALASTPAFCSWTLRRIAGIYEIRPFPADSQDEAACVEYVRAACVHHGLRACIHVRGVKTLWLEPPSGHLLLTLYTPHVKLTRAWIVFADKGHNPRHHATAVNQGVSTLSKLRFTRRRSAATWHRLALQSPPSPNSCKTICPLTMPNRYPPTSATYRRIVKDAAHTAIYEWLHVLSRTHMYFFEVDGVE